MEHSIEFLNELTHEEETEKESNEQVAFELTARLLEQDSWLEMEELAIPWIKE